MSKINKANTDKFRIVFSNIPIPSSQTEPLEIERFNNNVSNVTIPDYNLEVVRTTFGDTIRYDIVSKRNNDLSTITIEMLADEELKNYFAFFNWIKELKNGCATTGATSKAGSVINAVAIQMLDNQDRLRSTLVFKDCMIVSLSSLTFQFGTSEYLPFTITLNYTNLELTRSDTVANN